MDAIVDWMQAARRGCKRGKGTRIKLLDTQKSGLPPAVPLLTEGKINLTLPNQPKATHYPVARTPVSDLAAGNHPFTETANIGAVAPADLRFAL